MGSSAMSSNQECAECTKTAKPEFSCEKCRGYPRINDDEVLGEGAAYCSDKCRKNHSDVHQTMCQKFQDRRALARVAQFLQEGWLVFREHCFELGIKDMKWTEGDQKIVLLEIKKSEGLYRFDDEFTDPDDHRVKKALLTDSTCHRSVAYSSDLAKTLFGCKW
jgi:hypothetical protein